VELVELLGPIVAAVVGAILYHGTRNVVMRSAFLFITMTSLTFLTFYLKDYSQAALSFYITILSFFVLLIGLILIKLAGGIKWRS